MEPEYATADAFRYLTTPELQPILDVLASIAWPCSGAAVRDIITRLGWTEVSNRVHLMADAHLPLNRTLGEFAHPGGGLREVSLPVSDTVSSSDPRALSAVRGAFSVVRSSIESALGEPGGQRGSGDPQAWWDLATGGRVRLDSVGIRLQLRLVSPLDADVERFEESRDLSQYDNEE